MPSSTAVWWTPMPASCSMVRANARTWDRSYQSDHRALLTTKSVFRRSRSRARARDRQLALPDPSASQHATRA
eukprot:11170922-Heterocapsa_arctica.AAC.1